MSAKTRKLQKQITQREKQRNKMLETTGIGKVI